MFNLNFVQNDFFFIGDSFPETSLSLPRDRRPLPLDWTHLAAIPSGSRSAPIPTMHPCIDDPSKVVVWTTATRYAAAAPHSQPPPASDDDAPRWRGRRAPPARTRRQLIPPARSRFCLRKRRPCRRVPTHHPFWCARPRRLLY